MANSEARVSAEDFDALVEGLSQREGKRVYIEVGTKDPEEDLPGDAVPLRAWVVLGAVEPAHDTDRDRLMVMVRLPGLSRSCFYFDPQRNTRIVHHAGMFQVWFLNHFFVSLGEGIDVGIEAYDP